MRISDWSSDVCSSDLRGVIHAHVGDAQVAAAAVGERYLEPQPLLAGDRDAVAAAQLRHLGRVEVRRLVDVDLRLVHGRGHFRGRRGQRARAQQCEAGEEDGQAVSAGEIVRASWRERVWKYV